MLLLVLGLNFITLTGFTQDYKILQDAFSSSYSLETAGKYTAAIEVLEKQYDASSYEINLRLGWLHYLTGQFVESINYYNKSIQLMPLSVEARFGYVYPASALGNWDQVVAKYMEILRIDPSNYTANYRLGAIYYTRKEYGTAYKYFEKLVNWFPFDYDVLHMYAWTNYQMGKLREAKVLFHKALLNHPNDASCLEGLGLIK
ncbi:MAG: tetratricopeptide repeat protein [Bacteroidales bacterium]|nr:tetratricopeptide repeat protein [Bacteroidales bacterium]